MLFNNLNFKHLFPQKGMLWYLVMVLAPSEMAVSSCLNCRLLLAEGYEWFLRFLVQIGEGQPLSLSLTCYRYKNKRRTGHTFDFSPSILLSSYFTS